MPKGEPPPDNSGKKGGIKDMKAKYYLFLRQHANGAEWILYDENAKAIRKTRNKNDLRGLTEVYTKNSIVLDLYTEASPIGNGLYTVDKKNRLDIHIEDLNLPIKKMRYRI
jgi:hypothetical protein